jgi:hypothetical protein
VRWLALSLATLWFGCASGGGDVGTGPGPAAPPVEVLPPPGPRPLFAYETLDGRELSTDSLLGRFSVLGFAASYDLASQAQVRFLTGLLRDHSPRINVALLVLEAPENRPLVEAYVSTLKLPYPVALADASTIAGEGPFSGMHHVPGIIIIDPQGREVFRHAGLMTQEALEQLLRKLERRSPPTQLD